ncbi:MAG TPA: hypothetical protein VFT22_23055 [Kofleriaceae bacterium]|nr:hypothetical protein [Kofleriaceae bacterium]
MRSSAFLLVVVATSQLGATDCDGNITRDPGFDLWCGEALCAWKLERGDLRRVPTWHAADSGVELLGPDSAIEQFTPVDSGDGTCIRFDLIADVDETAQVELGVDIYGDGTIERAFPIPTAHWKPLSYAFAVQAPYTGIRFEIARHGPGRAVVARMRAQRVIDGCDGVAPLSGGPAPLGALCLSGADCASGICDAVDFFSGLRCAGCDPARPSCSAGQVCGVDDPGPPERAVPIACVAAASRELGEDCLGDAECAGGVCAGGVCSTCRPEAGCAGAVCDRAYDHGPYLCAPGSHAGAPGAPCATDDDCASGACSGAARLQCPDGRACATDASCPVDSNLMPGPCSTVGVQGGSCD